MKSNPTKKMKIHAWGVINTELNCPCVFIDEKTNYALGAAIFVGNPTQTARQEAYEYAKDTRDKNGRLILSTKVVPVTITYEI